MGAGLSSTQWYLDAIGVRGLAEQGVDGRGVTVAVLDSGIQKRHAGLQGFWRNPGEVPGNGLDDDLNGYADDVSGWDMCHDAPARDDPPWWHGTFVAGVLRADGRGGPLGIAPGVELMDLQVFCDDDTHPERDPVLQTDALREGIRYAVDNGADIISISMQAWPDFGHSLPEDLLGVRDEFEHAEASGVLLVAAAGNTGASGPESPGDMPHVFTIGATTGCGFRHGFSNHGPGVDLWAPGRALSLRDGEPVWEAGTSFATPMVAGSAALLLQREPGLAPEEVRQRLLAAAGTSEDGPVLDMHDVFGTAAAPSPGSIRLVGPEQVPDPHYIQWTGDAAPLLEIRVQGAGAWCYRTDGIAEETFLVRTADGPVDVSARLHDGRQAGPWTQVRLVHDPDAPAASPRPLWTDDAPVETQDSPAGLLAVVTGLGVAAALRRKARA